MIRAFLIRLLLLFTWLHISAPQFHAAQEPAPSASTPSATAILKVSLRLPDDTPFFGAATVRVMPEEGYELVGGPADNPADFMFREVTPGKYVIEVTAPGYLSARLKTQIENGHHQRTMFVVMKARSLPTTLPKTESVDLTAMAASAPISAAPIQNSLPPENAPKHDYWRLHELEENVPSVDATIPCPTQEILNNVGQRMAEFVSSLEKFTATETVEHYPIASDGSRKSSDGRKFAYVVVITQTKNQEFYVEEFRNGSTDVEQFPARIASQGLPALALLFHPTFAKDFAFRCEGLGQWSGREVWQLHFVQRDDRRVRIRSYYIGGRIFDVHLEGRAWIDPGSAQIVRLESELASPIPEIDLKAEHIFIEYQPVQFRSTGQQIWLPHFADLYVERQGRRYYRRHAFSDFKLFNVDTTQTLRAPEGSYAFTNTSDGDIRTQLTVSPREDSSHSSAVLRFVVPAHARIIKVIGPGKDIDLPLASVESATVLHDGKDGSLNVEVLMIKDTTLDVLPEAAIPQQP